MSLKTPKIRFNQAAEISNDRVVPNRVDLFSPIRPKWRSIRPILRRELDKNRAVAISAVVIALPSSHYRNRNRYCTEIGRTNPINDSNGSWPSRPRKRYDFDPSRQSARRNYDRWPVLRAGGEREKKIGSIGTLAGADTVNLPRANRIACPRSVGHSVADRFIRNSRVGYHARHRVTRLSGQRFFPWQEWGGVARKK